jgi:hypothetical protein
MPKDRFSKFKPVNWNNNWKKTGNQGNRYNTLERKDTYDAYVKNAELKQKITIQKQTPVVIKPKKQLRTLEQTQFLQVIYTKDKQYLSEWEQNFIRSILSVPFQITVKQRDVLRNIIHKIDLAKKIQ